ncbi:MAG: YhbY family RNA-binding protein [Promethearchaeota archaeon]
MKITNSSIKTALNIGKNGISDGQLEHIKNFLRHERAIKIRVLKNAITNGRDVDFYANIIKSKLGVKILDIRGNTFIVIK